MTKQPKILVLLCPSLNVELFSPKSGQVLHPLAELVFRATETKLEAFDQQEFAYASQ